MATTALHRRQLPPGFPTAASFADELEAIGAFMLRRVTCDTHLYRLMAVQASVAPPGCVREYHVDLRGQGRIIITVTLDGDGVISLQGLQSDSTSVSVTQTCGDFYAIWGPYVLPLDAREDPSFQPGHMVLASSSGRVSLTFRFGFADSAQALSSC